MAIEKDPKTGRIIGRSDVEVNSQPKDPEDFFHYAKKDPNFSYHWALNNPRRVQQLQREGYEVDPSATAKEAGAKVDGTRKYLERVINDPAVSKEDALAAKEALDQLSVKKLDTTVNIPEHIMMRTSVENKRKREEAKLDRSKSMEKKIESDIRELQKAMQRSGKGGIKAFKDLFDSIK